MTWVVWVRRFVGGVVQTLTKFNRVTWVHKILMGIKKQWQGSKFWCGWNFGPYTLLAEHTKIQNFLIFEFKKQSSNIRDISIQICHSLPIVVLCSKILLYIAFMSVSIIVSWLPFKCWFYVILSHVDYVSCVSIHYSCFIRISFL